MSVPPTPPTALYSEPRAAEDWVGAFARLLRLEFAHHKLLIGFVAVYLAITMAVISASDRTIDFIALGYLAAAALPIVVVVALRAFGEFVHFALHVRPFCLQNYLKALRKSEICSSRHAAAALFPVLLLPIFSTAFTSFKLTIPDLKPFSWDPVLMQADKALHFGAHPWHWLQPLFGHPLVSSSVSYLYNAWFPLLMFVLYWQFFSMKDRQLRMRFLLSFFIAFAVLGSFFALLFSSAGPWFYGEVVVGPNPYDGLMVYLREADATAKIWSLEAQEYLQAYYRMKDANLGGGISAMPSLHVAAAALMFFLCRARDRRLAWLSGLYVGVIIVGSVHLGWHYAVDGYFGLAGAVVAWWISGWLTRCFVPAAPRCDDRA